MKENTKGLTELKNEVDKLFEMRGDTTHSLECAWYYSEYGSKESLERDKEKVINIMTKLLTKPLAGFKKKYS